MELYSLLYSSAETEPMTELGLADLLIKAREYNQSHDITGMLLYRKCSFMQLLEGDKEVIEDLYDSKIILDDRHIAVTKFYTSHIDERIFPDWSMGFKIISDDAIKSIGGYSNFLEDGFDTDGLKEEPAIAIQILRMFSGNSPPF